MARILLSGDPDGYAWLPLADDELIALGAVAAHWSLLEYGVNLAIAQLCQVVEVEMSPKFWRAPFRKRLDKWRELIKANPSLAQYGKSALDLIDSIGSVQNDRDKAMHRAWGVPDNPDSGKRVLINLPGLGPKEYEWKMKPDTLNKIALKIFQIDRDIQALGPGYEAAVRPLPGKER